MCHSIQPCTACMLWACSCSCCTICLSLGILPFPCLERVNKPLIKLCQYGFIYLMRTSTSTPHTITLCLETSNKTTRILDTIIHPAHGEQIYYRMDLACADIVNITRRSESGRVIYLQATLHEWHRFVNLTEWYRFHSLNATRKEIQWSTVMRAPHLACIDGIQHLRGRDHQRHGAVSNASQGEGLPQVGLPRQPLT